MNIFKLSSMALVSAVLMAACASPTPTAAPAKPAEAAKPVASTGPGGKPWKLAGVFPGTITDADYNQLGYVAMKRVEKDMGIKIAQSENVAVPDVERVMKEYIADGSNIIFAHGSQFVNQAAKVAKENPDVFVIAENDAAVPDAPANFWLLDRNFYLGAYVSTRLAAEATKANKIAYLGGSQLPFSWAEVHAAQQAVKDSGKNVAFKYVFTGDFNNPAKARELAEALISEGNDVIIGSLNLGMLGLFEAVKGKPTLVTAKYTDKSQFSPDNYVTSVLYDFEPVLLEVVGGITSGAKKGGIYSFGWGQGVSMQKPYKKVSDAAAKVADQVMDDIKSGKLKVEKNSAAIP